MTGSSASPDGAGSGFRRSRFEDLAGWGAADAGHETALEAFRRSAPRLRAGSYERGTLGLDPAALREATEAAGTVAPGEARRFFEHFFRPARIEVEGETAGGFMTGYYEPVIEASAVRTADFTVPLHRRPDDLVAVANGEGFSRRLADGRLVEHPDRAAIARGALDGRGLEIAFLRDPVDAFFIHVQGSARLELTDGRTLRVGFSGKTGHGFTAIGRILVSEGELVLEKADMEGIRLWLRENPLRVRALLDRNRSYIFFREVEGIDRDAGPVGAAAVPLTPLASLAVDRELHTFGTPLFVAAPTLRIGAGPFGRLMVAQDTGSAIRGATRGDIFVGSGAESGRIAGAVRHPATVTALLPVASWEGLPR